MNIFGRTQLNLRSTVAPSFALLLAALVPQQALAVCSASDKSSGCILPAHEAPTIPSSAEVLGGTDQFSVSEFTGAVQVQSTDLELPWQGAAAPHFTRTYHSNRLMIGESGGVSPDFIAHLGPLGLGWTFHYGLAWYNLTPTNPHRYTLLKGDGTRENFFDQIDAATGLGAVAGSGEVAHVSKSLATLVSNASTPNTIHVHFASGVKWKMEKMDSLSGVSCNSPKLCAAFVTTEVSDLSGNKWTVAYSASQEYLEHPVIASVTDDLMRTISFNYTSLPSGGTGSRPTLTSVTHDGRVYEYRHTSIPGVTGHRVLDEVETPAGRITKFGWVTPADPKVNEIGLLESIRSPLGGGIALTWEFAPRSLPPTAVPSVVYSQQVKTVARRPSSITSSADQVLETYTYQQVASAGTEPKHLETTIAITAPGGPPVTRVQRAFDYEADYCLGSERAGLTYYARLEQGTEFVESRMDYGSTLTISSREANPNCSTVGTRVYRVTSATTKDSALAAPGASSFDQTVTYQNYDLMSPGLVVSSPGTTQSTTYSNVISVGRLELGLPTSQSVSLGTSLLRKMELVYETALQDTHLVKQERLFHDSSNADTITLTHSAAAGAKGAVETAERGGVTETYTYQQGLLSKVERGGVRVERSGVTSHGTYSSELRDGVTTALTWDDDLRVTGLTVGSLPTVHVSYHSRNAASGDNWICVGKGSACMGGTPPAGGGRTLSFDGLGQKILEQDLIQSGYVTKSWSDFDYAGRPTSYVDPTRGTLTLAYDVAGRMLSEMLGSTVVTQLERAWNANSQTTVTTKEGVVLTDVDDWTGRATYRGTERDGQGMQGLRYTWQQASGGWTATIGPATSPTAPPSFTIEETYDLLGRLVSEHRPEVGTVTHGYDGRGFRTSTTFASQSGSSRCYQVNDLGLVEETWKKVGGCSTPPSTTLRSATFYPDTQEAHVVTGRGTTFRPVDVRRTYGAAAADGQLKSLEVRIPRALDAPAPWVGGEVFPAGPNALDDFRGRNFAFAKVDEAESDGFYEVEVRIVPASTALLPNYDWARAQEQCEAADTTARGPWNAPNPFKGQDLEAHLETLTSGGVQPPPPFPWDLSPDTLYCWRVRAVQCHDGAPCAKQELGPAGTWGLFAFQSSQAQPVARDGWLEDLPTNRALNPPEQVQACLTGSCPHRPTEIDSSWVTLSAQRARNAGGRDVSWVYPEANTELMDWARGGSTVTYTRNGLGDVETIKFRFSGETSASDRTLLRHTSYSAVGAPDAGTLNLFGYQNGQPGDINIISVGGEDGARAVDSQVSLTLDWGYDGKGRLSSWHVSQGGDSVLQYDQITYTGDSLVSGWTRNDPGHNGATPLSVSYDARGQLKSFVYGATGSQRVDFTFDDRGNLTGRANGISVTGLNRFGYDGTSVLQTTDGAVELPAAALGSYGTDNRSTAPGVAYDGQGRLTQRDGRIFSYSGEDHLETVSGALGMERQMVYDGEGNLVRLVAGPEVHYYLRDDTGRLIYEEVHDGWFYGEAFRDGNGNVIPHVRRYEYIYDEASHIATIEHADGVSSLSYSLRDWRDHEAVSLDADEAFAKHYHDPSPFGLEMRRRASEVATHAQLVAPHRQRLGIAGLQNNGWRTIGAEWGRFTIPDPARARHERLPQGLNLYTNNLNNPMMYRDRDGQIAFLIPAAIIAYRVYSAYSTANDVVNAVEMVMDPNTTTEDVVTAGVSVLASVALGKVGGVAVKAGMRYAKGGVRRVVKIAAAKLRGKSCVINSFAAGTLVALSTAAGAVPIEDLEVGDRVATVAGTSDTEVDDTWGIVELDLDIGRRVTLLRPPKWFAAHDLRVGERTTVAFSLGSDGLITGVVRDVRGFAGPAKGPGRVVLATLEGTADEVHLISFDGVDAPLRATADHPLYSLDRDKWVGAEELTVGERLQTAEGAVRIAALERERGARRVLNLEVEGEHEYLVGDAEVRAHNAKCGGSGKRRNIGVDHNTRKSAKDAARHAHHGKPRPTPKKSDTKKRKQYEEQQKYKKPESHQDSKHPESHFHDGNKSQSDINRHHTFPQ